MPQSRLTRQNCSEDDLHILEVFDGFKGRMQNEFNAEPYGPYMGPYDQSEKLPLKLQLPKNKLCFETYKNSDINQVQSVQVFYQRIILRN